MATSPFIDTPTKLGFVGMDNYGNEYWPTQPLPGGSVMGAATGPAPQTQEQIQAAQQAQQEAQAKADSIAYLQDQQRQLQGLLGRTDTNLSQGLARNEDQYQLGVGETNASRDRQVVAQNQAKQGAYDTINRNAASGYRSLAQIIGRASGTGSSAFRDLLPNVIGNDTSAKRQNATDVYGQNLSNIDSATTSSLNDLLRQKKTNEESIRGDVERQRQSIQEQISKVVGDIVQTNGGHYAQIAAAQSPYRAAIDASRNAVEGFFNNFRTPYTPAPVDPNLSQYQTDRSVVNARNSGQTDGSSAYSQLLRKRLQGAI